MGRHVVVLRPSPPLAELLLVLPLPSCSSVKSSAYVSLVVEVKWGGGWAGCLAHVFPLIGCNTPVWLLAQRKRETQIQFECVALRFPLMRKFDDHIQLGLHHRLSAPAGSRTLCPSALDLLLNGA